MSIQPTAYAKEGMYFLLISEACLCAWYSINIRLRIKTFGLFSFSLWQVLFYSDLKVYISLVAVVTWVKSRCLLRDFNVICIPYNVTELEQDFKTGLLETCPSSSALPFLSATKGPRQTEEEVWAFISSDVNFCKEENVQSVHVYSMHDYEWLILKKWCLQFLKNLQLNSLILFHLMKSKQKWSTRKLPINPSLNFGLIKGEEELHLPHFTLCATLERAQTEETLLNISLVTVQLLKMPCHDRWHGRHEKEKWALGLYIKKQNKNHEKLSIEKGGLIVNTLWPFLGASPDGIRICAYCQKKLIEVKSMYAKMNLLPHVTAEENLMLVDGKYEI